MMYSPVGKHLVQTLVVSSVNCQLISEFSGYLRGLFTAQMAAHAFAAHQLTSSSYVDAGLGPFVCFKFWHLPVLLLDPDFYRLILLS